MIDANLNRQFEYITAHLNIWQGFKDNIKTPDLKKLKHNHHGKFIVRYRSYLSYSLGYWFFRLSRWRAYSYSISDRYYCFPAESNKESLEIFTV